MILIFEMIIFRFNRFRMRKTEERQNYSSFGLKHNIYTDSSNPRALHQTIYSTQSRRIPFNTNSSFKNDSFALNSNPDFEDEALKMHRQNLLLQDEIEDLKQMNEDAFSQLGSAIKKIQNFSKNKKNTESSFEDRRVDLYDPSFMLGSSINLNKIVTDNEKLKK